MDLGICLLEEAGWFILRGEASGLADYYLLTIHPAGIQ